MLLISIYLAVIAIYFWLLYRRTLFTAFTKTGIPGPKPNIIFGNLDELTLKTPVLCHQQWIKKFGDVVGFFVGSQPCVLINNPDLLKKIQIADFSSFADRPVILTNMPWRNSSNDYKHNLVRLNGKRWKEVRSVLTQTFTASKMKQMVPVINNAVDIFMDKVQKEAISGRSFDIYKFYQGLSLDVIGRTAFGIDTDVQKNENDQFLKMCRSIFSLELSTILFRCYLSFPEFSFITNIILSLFLRFQNGGSEPVSDLTSISKKVVALRKADSTNRRQDLIQLLLKTLKSDSEVINEDLRADEDKADNTTESPNVASISNPHKSQLRLSDDEIVVNATLFLFAGYETTSTALGFITHLLVHHPEVQQRVRDEVLDVLKKHGKFNYSTIQELQFLHQVLTESLRMYPPAYQFSNRKVKEDIILDGYHFKKGMTLIAPAYSLQRDERYWDNPEMFNPDRFAPENQSKNNQYAYQVFGSGPRNCIGMRFAQMEVKLALVKLLSQYRLEKCSETDKLDISLRVTNVAINPKNGVFVRAVPL